MANYELRLQILKSGLYQWEIARAMNISEATFSRMLRLELPDEKTEEIIKIINQLSKSK